MIGRHPSSQDSKTDQRSQRYDDHPHSRLPAHRRTTRTQIRPGIVLERRLHRGGPARHRPRAARTSLERSARGRARPRHRRRLRLVRPGAADRRAAGCPAHTLRLRPGPTDAGAVLRAGARQRRPRRHGNDQVVRHQLPLPRARTDAGPAESAVGPRHRMAVRRGARSAGRRAPREGGAARPRHVPALGQGARRAGRQAVAAAAVAAGLCRRAPAPGDAGGGMGADRRTRTDAGPAEGLGGGVRPGLCNAGGGQRPQAAARHVFRSRIASRGADQVAAGGRRAPGPGPRAAAARSLRTVAG